MTVDILEYLSDKLDCEYLSDLHHTCVFPRQVQFILEIPPGCFSLEDYRKALYYITGKKSDCTDIPRAKQCLIDALCTSEEEE